MASARKASRLPRRADSNANVTDDELGALDLPGGTPGHPAEAIGEGATTIETPYASLRQLAGIIQKPTTPHRRASSVGAISNRKVNSRTPVTLPKGTTLERPSRPVPAKRGPPTTPHAIRALQQRRAATGLTPGRDRRRSGRQQRETPRDTLRDLSRVLSKVTKPIVPSPQTPSLAHIGHHSGRDDLEDDADLPAPRFSMPIDEGADDDSFIAAPPRLSLAPEDDNHTRNSVEGPRRDFAEHSFGRFSRGSLGSLRSERFIDLGEGNEGDASMNEAMFSPGIQDRYGDDLDDEIYDGGDTEDLRRMIFDPSGEQSAVMSESHVPVEEAETSFAFNIPGNAARNPSELSEPDSGAEEYTKQLGLESQETDLTLQTEEHSSRPLKPGRKLLKFSRHGIPYPSLPAGVVKKLATTFARSSGHSKTRINKDCLSAIMQASEWFFEQAGDDLGTYAEHAGRKTIDETDIITLMKRQRQLGANTTPFSLAQKYLPRELLQDVRMAPPAAIKPPKKQKLKTVVEENEARNETSP